MKNTLLENFYEERASTFSPGNRQEFKCLIHLNAAHPVYQGHFPQMPVVPGVCLVQIIKEILMKKFQRDLVLSSGDNIKFLAMVNPLETPELEITFSVKDNGHALDVNASYACNGTTYTKFKGKFGAPQ